MFLRDIFKTSPKVQGFDWEAAIFWTYNFDGVNVDLIMARCFSCLDLLDCINYFLDREIVQSDTKVMIQYF